MIWAAYQLTHDFDAAHEIGHKALRPRYGPATLIHVNDERGHAAVLALFRKRHSPFSEATKSSEIVASHLHSQRPIMVPGGCQSEGAGPRRLYLFAIGRSGRTSDAH